MESNGNHKIYLLGASGNIGKNISYFFKKNEIKFTGVSRIQQSNTIDFDSFLLEIKSCSEVLIINAATLSRCNLHNLSQIIDSGTRIIHISSVAVYGNTDMSNVVSPVNQYGELKSYEEKIFIRSLARCVIIRLANIYGGKPETSRVFKLYRANKLTFVQVDENGIEFVRDFIEIDEFLRILVKYINFNKSLIINASSGTGLTISDWFLSLDIDISHIDRVITSDKAVIRKSIVDPNFTLEI